MADGVPFGNYRLLRRLARGGMAEVFLARHVGVEGFERRVAIKRILPHLSESEEFRDMFLDEARLAAQLTHPNIVHIYDFGKFDDYYFIAMEYVDGIDLGRLIRQAKARPVPFEFAARILADVCSGLHYAHNVSDGQGRKLNLVHRDVTPQNVLVTYDGVVKLVDFGIAKAAWSAGRTRPGVVKGKFAYMSPEQVQGRTLDGRSDLFSAAICLYELITGVPLYRRDDVNAAMREIRDGKPIVPEKFRADVPDALTSILRRALATSRDQRYASAGAMQLDLERFLKESEALGTSQLLGEYVQREVPRPPDEDAAGPGTQAQPAGTQRQAAGTQRQAAGTQVQVAGTQSQHAGTQSQHAGTQSQERADTTRADPTPPPGALTEPLVDAEVSPALPVHAATDDSLELAITTPGRAPEDAPTKPVESPRRKPEPIDRPPSHTAVVPPLQASSRRAYVAAAVAAVTVITVGLIALHPWSSSQASMTTIDPTIGPGVSGNPATENSPRVPDPKTQNEPQNAAQTKPQNEPQNGTQNGTQNPPQNTAQTKTQNEPQNGTQTKTQNEPQNAAQTKTPGGAKTGTTAPVEDTAAPAALDVVSRPAGARVTVDGHELPKATPVRAQSLAAGTHRVSVERKGYLARELSVQLGAGEHRTLDVVLRAGQTRGHVPPRAAAGFLTVRTVPWSKVFEGSRLLGTTPLANVHLSEGSHALTFVNPDLPPVHKTVTVRAGEESRLSFELKK
ncbi:MAG TPA: protein kinase [Polyangia bacterium]|nr:protein kinase [Polyangia bacterium]